MKRTILFLAAIIFTASTYSQTTFQKAYGGTAMDEAKSVKQTFDGGYIIAGTTTSFGSGGRDVLVIKTDFKGDTTWTKTFGGATDNEYGFCVQQTTDSGYVISGVASSFDDVAGDMYIIKLTQNGDTSWTRTYGGIGYEWGSYVQQTTDGGYVIAGQTPAFGAGGFDAYLVKVNSTGNITWTKTYGGSGSEVGTAVQQTTDGGYILLGEISSFGAGGADFYLVKGDSTGTTIWSKAYGLGGTEMASIVRQTSDSGYVIAGTSENSLGPLGPDMCLIKTNSIGDTLWAKLYGGTLIDECYDVIQTQDGGYILCGKSFSFSASGDYDVYVVKVNNAGAVQWSKSYGNSSSSSANEIGYSIQQTADGGYIIAGESLFGFGVGLQNVYLIKTDSLGQSGCNELNPNTVTSNLMPIVTNVNSIESTGGVMNKPSTILGQGTTQTDLCANIVNSVSALSFLELIQLYPNPSSSYLNINFNSINNEVKEIIIYDITGKQQFYQKTTRDLSININHLSQGIYIIKITEGNYFRIEKFIIE